MNIQSKIDEYIDSLPAAKGAEVRELHGTIVAGSPDCPLQFSDGRDDTDKVVSNPTIGYGSHTLTYANGTSRTSFRIGVSANTTGISVYILGLKDKSFLADTYGGSIGKATVTGYCIKFRSLKNINMSVLEQAIRYGFSLTN
ncbi:MAG: DUF1801 domain-containing protein [Bacteroidetes bacterium]|nr:DUF1801 domain-containing protein [Bacteroidota bacterium]